MSVRKVIEDCLDWLQTPQGKQSIDAAIVVIDDLLGPDDIPAPIQPKNAQPSQPPMVDLRNLPNAQPSQPPMVDLRNLPKVRRANAPSTEGMKR